MTEGQAGIPLQLEITVLDTACQTLPGVYVEVSMLCRCSKLKCCFTHEHLSTINHNEAWLCIALATCSVLCTEINLSRY